MARPKAIFVLGETYKIVIKKGLLQDGIYGDCDKVEKIITLDSSLVKEEYWESLIHEIGHAIMHEASIEQSVSPQLEEVIVDLFAKVLVKNLKIS